MIEPEDCLLKFEIPEVIYGLGALSQIGQCCRRLGGERILLVTDSGLIAAGWVDESIKYLSEEDLQYVIYDNVVTNPRDFQVEEGAELYRRKKCDVIVAVGGGSPIDTAKGIGILSSIKEGFTNTRERIWSPNLYRLWFVCQQRPEPGRMSVSLQ